MKNDISKTIIQEINKIGKLWNIPNIMCGIVIDNRVEEIVNWSNTNISTERLPENSIFRIGSNSKSFACSALMQLVTQYNISIHDRVVEYYPEFQLYHKELTKNVCIKDIVTHHVGLGKFTSSMMGFLNYQSTDIINSMRHIPVHKPFRTSFQYHNAMYLIIEKILSNVANCTVEEFYANHFLDPLNMKYTSTSLTDSGIKIAPPCVEICGQNKLITQSRFSDCLGIGTNLNTTVDDMLKWIIFNLEQFSQNSSKFKNTQQQFYRYVSFQSNSKTTLLDDYITWHGYTLGWYSNQFDRFTLYEHLGGVPGYTSYLSFIPELDAGIVLLCNKSNMRYPLELIRLIFFHALVNNRSFTDISYDLFEQTMNYQHLLDCKISSFEPTKLPRLYHSLNLRLFNPMYQIIKFMIRDSEILIYFESVNLTFKCFYTGNNTFVLIDHLHHFSTLLKLITLQFDRAAKTLEMKIFIDNQQGGLSWIADHLFTEIF
jgi:CubicO group peptidase (beta-lactamase class C family)